MGSRVKDEDIVKAIKVYIDTHGYAPSIREICSLVGLHSTATVHNRIKKLIEKGYLQKEDMKPRTIKLNF
ncbi:MAG: winged helix DNA-binding protein [Candidatus Anstonellales archaeon]